MSGHDETPLLFGQRDRPMVGIVATPPRPQPLGVLILVGGPQYRVGSHRQFVRLARALAAAGYASLRFDYPGMGDSEGSARSFDDVQESIALAIDAFLGHCPALRSVVVWALCDAASAALLYWLERRDPRLAAMCLLNPWVRSDATLARAQMKHYYWRRLLRPEFWRNLATGKVQVVASGQELLGKLRLLARRDRSAEGAAPFQTRMALALRQFPGPVLLILSGEDYAAKEFLDRAASDAAWAGVLERPNLTRQDMPGADHTFSASRFARQAEDRLLAWLDGLREREPAPMELEESTGEST